MINNYVTKELGQLLARNVEARDNMVLCVKHIHDLEMQLLNVTENEYYIAFFGGKLSSVKTIDRIWRKLQEDIPELRGSEWEARQAQSGRIDITDLSYLKNQLNLF
jgi:hypothetical protein